MHLRIELVAATTAMATMMAACGGGNAATGSTGTHATGTSASSTGSGAGGHGGAGTGAGGAGGGGYPGPHAAPPQVPNQGGPRLLHPQVVTVTFAGDPRAATFESFAQWIVGSKWLTAVGTEYGIGAGAVAGVAHRPETPPAMMTSADIETYLANGIADSSIPRPAAPATLADALYIVYYPATTSIATTFVDGIVKQSCTDFVAYHGEAHQAGLDFAYAAVPDCSVAVPPLTAVKSIELFTSHEFLEAATDAFPITAPAWQLEPDPTSAWFAQFQFEVEVGDLCEVQSRYIEESGFIAQRTWSNVAAAAGRDPCVPADPAVPYFNTSATPGTVVHAAPGTSVDYALQGWSTAPVSDWTLEVLPGVLETPTLNVTTKLSTSKLNNGGTATLHVDIPANAVSGTSATLTLFSQHSAADANPWFLAIEVP